MYVSHIYLKKKNRFILVYCIYHSICNNGPTLFFDRIQISIQRSIYKIINLALNIFRKMYKNHKKALIFLCASLAVVNSYSIPGRGSNFASNIATDLNTNTGSQGGLSGNYGSGKINIKGCDPNPCSDAQACINGKCFDKCKFTDCEEGTQCLKGECIPIDPCRDVKCEKWHECIEGECIAYDPCRDVTCEKYYECSYGQCLVTDPCFGACKDYEQCTNDGQCVDKCKNMKCNYGCSQGQCREAPKIPSVGSSLGYGYQQPQNPFASAEQVPVAETQEIEPTKYGPSNYGVRQSVGNSGGSYNPTASNRPVPPPVPVKEQPQVKAPVIIGSNGSVQININTSAKPSANTQNGYASGIQSGNTQNGYSSGSQSGATQNGYASGSQSGKGSSIGIKKCQKDYQCGYGSQCKRGFCQ